jgi:peptide maturation system protein (TIGR04066 family)
MNEINKIAVIYPIKKEYVEIIKYKNMLKGFEKIIPVSLVGQGIEHRDVGEFIKGEPLGMEVTSDFETSIQDATEIIFTEFSELVYEKMIYSMEQKKNIICLFKLEDEVEVLIIQTCKNKGITYKNYCNSKEVYPEVKDNKLHKINVPILLICGISEYTNKFELQLKARNEFLKRGYNVSQVGSKEYSRLFGMHNFPEFMFSNMQDVDKIYRFNSYIKEIENTEEPEILIIGVPGGAMQYDADHPNGFGIINYLVSNALTVDVTMLSLAFNEYDESFWDFAENYMKYRYEYPVQSFHLSNIFHDVYGDERNDQERLVYINQNKVNEKIASFDRKDVFNLNNEEAFIKTVDEIIDYLSN